VYIDSSRYGFPILLSFRPQSAPSWPVLAKLCELLAPVVLHSTTPLDPAGDRATTDSVDRLRHLAGEGALKLWNGGFAGAPTPILTTAELDWERCWGQTNRWGTGLEQILETHTEAYYPNGLVPAQARVLSDRARMPICGGYRPGDREPIRDLFTFEDGRWTRRTVLVLDGNTRFVPKEAIDLVHLIVDGADPSPLPDFVESLAGRINASASRGDTRENGNAPPGCARLVNGIDTRYDASLLLASAVAARRRREIQGVTERTRTVLWETANIPENARETDGTSPEVIRELQGMTSGLTEIVEGPVRARFAAGRPAGLTIDGHDVLLPIRSQGWARPIQGRRPRTIWLEGDAAAWFTTFTTRGIQERSRLVLGDTAATLSVGIRSTISEELPALRIHLEISVPADPPAVPWLIEPIQLPLAWFSDDTKIRIESLGIPGVAESCTFRAEDLPLSLPGSALRITVADRSILVAIDGTAPQGFFSLSLGAPAEGRRSRSTARRRRDERILWFNPAFSIRGDIPQELAGSQIAATYLITHGSHDPAVLRRLSEQEELPLRWTTVPLD